MKGSYECLPGAGVVPLGVTRFTGRFFIAAMMRRARGNDRPLPAFRRHADAIAAHLALQPGLRQPPVAHHRLGRHLQDRGRFLDAQPAEEPQLDDAALALVELRQRLQRVVERDEVLTGSVGDDERLVEASPSPPRRRASDSAARARGPRGCGASGAPPPRGSARGSASPLPAVDEPEVRLVDERRRLEAVARALARHAAARDPVQLPVDERNQSLEGTLVALPPLEQQPGDVRGMVGNAPIVVPFLPRSRFRHSLTLYRQGPPTQLARHQDVESRQERRRCGGRLRRFMPVGRSSPRSTGT